MTQTQVETRWAVGDRLTVRIESLVHGGDGLARSDGKVVFVPFTVPGELVEAELTEVHPDFARGTALEILEASPDRVEPPCVYFGECGGCQWQHVAYPAQLLAKERTVRDQLRRIGGFEDPPVRPVIGGVDPWAYRNHARFTARRSGHLGFTRIDHRRFIQIDRCLIMQEPINEALAELQGDARGKRLHQVAIRCSPRTGDFLISPEIQETSATIKTGQPFYEDELLGRRFRVSASSFFQVHTRPERRDLSAFGLDADLDVSQAEVLILLARSRLKLTGKERLIDAYCGGGTFALALSAYCREAIGIEESASSLRDARHNLGDTDNVSFVQGKVEQILPEMAGTADAMVIDPPRAGCRPEVLRAIVSLQPKRLFYVSCEPSTLARDLRILVDSGFWLEEVQPVDLFPQTAHIESCSTLIWEPND